MESEARGLRQAWHQRDLRLLQLKAEALILGPRTGIKDTCSGHFARTSWGRGRGHLGGGAL